MFVTIGNKTKKSMKVLGIESYPFTETEIKSRFREKVKASHSDKTGGDDILTRKLIDAYSHIKYLAIKDNEIKDKGEAILKAEKESEDMFELFDTCKKCNGKGKIIQHHKAYIDLCDRCMGHSLSFFSFRDFPTGKIKVRCRDCRGTGKFKQRSGRVVSCRQCEGRGWLYIKCPKCKGKRTIFIKAHTIENICLNCSGTGRVKINLFNPVIPKGAVLQRRKLNI